MYQYAKRYVTTLLFLCNNLLILVVVSDFTPFLLHAILILLNGLLIVHVSYDRTSYGPLLLIKIFISTNFYKPSSSVMDIVKSLDKVIDRIIVNNIDNIDKNAVLVNIVTMSYERMLKQAVIQNKTATIYIPNDNVTYDELTHDESALQVYCVNRNDIAGVVTHIENKLIELERMQYSLDMIKNILRIEKISYANNTVTIRH